jgi:MYXO-CTERM domain-containing protein
MLAVMRAAVWSLAFALAPTAALAAPSYVKNPYATKADGPVRIDVQAGTVNGKRVPLVEQAPQSAVRFEDLDAYYDPTPPEPSADFSADLPDGFVQRGGTIVPEEVLEGALMVGDLSLTDGSGTQEGTPAATCAYPEEVPPGIYEGDSRRGGEFPRRGTVYLNFLGGVLENMGENSAENYSTIARSGHPYPQFSGGQAKAVAVAQAVAEDFARWGIRVVYDPRPRKVLPYTMAVVGGSYSDTTSGPAGGVAPIDCEDFGQRNVCYSFTNNEPATSQANVISQEVAHTYGLEHTYGADRIMSYEGGGDKIFGSNCQQTFALQGQGNGCQGVNKCHCGIGDLQDDSLTIGIIFAPFDAPDVTPPEVTLTAPPDGAVYQVGEEIVVDFEVGDDFGGYGWKLVITNEAGEVLVDQADYDRALTFDIVGLPAGVYTFTGEIEDHADHITTHSITVIIEGEAGTTSGAVDTSGGGSADSSGSDPTDADSSGDADGSSGGGSGSGGADADEGCACTTSPTRAPWSLLAIAMLGLRRRRGASPE